MKRLIALLLLSVSFAHADSLTTNVGLVKPDVGSTGWGTKTNTNWDIIDSSFVIPSGTYTFTGENTFSVDTNFTRLVFEDNQESVFIGTNAGADYVGAGFTRPSVLVGPNAFRNNPMNRSIGSVAGGNVGVGNSSFGENYYGLQNTGIGDSSCTYLASGSYNVCLGYGSGHGNGGGTEVVVATNTILIGQYTGASSSSTHLSNSVAIGAFAKVNASDAMVLGTTGNSGANSFNVGIGTDIPKGALHVVGKAGDSSSSYSLIVSTSGQIADYHLAVSSGGVVLMKNSTISGNVLYSSMTGTHFTASTATITNLRGTVTNDNATTGSVGEYLSAAVTTNTSFPTSNQFGDAASIAITAGDWDIDASIMSTANGATVTGWDVGLSTTSGNTSANLIYGSNVLQQVVPNATYNTAMSLPAVRMSWNESKTIYLKVRAVYSAATPQYVCRISARRRR